MNLSRSLTLLLTPFALGVGQRIKGKKTIQLSNETVHWGYFSKTLEPVLTVDSGEKVVVEVSTYRRKVMLILLCIFFTFFLHMLTELRYYYFSFVP